jgi:hypothetical protein
VSKRRIANREHEPNKVESADERTITEKPEEGEPTEVQFKLRVRKLNVPVRPRGVLAE